MTCAAPVYSRTTGGRSSGRQQMLDPVGSPPNETPASLCVSSGDIRLVDVHLPRFMADDTHVPFRGACDGAFRKPKLEKTKSA